MIDPSSQSKLNELVQNAHAEKPEGQSSQATQIEKISDCAAHAHITPTREMEATKIQKAWRIHRILKRESIPKAQTEPRQSQWKPRTDRLMLGPIVKGPHGPKHEISINTIDKVVTHLIEKKDQEGLQRLANILFSGPLKLNLYGKNLDLNPSVKALQGLLKNPDADPKILKETFMQAVKEWRSGNDQPAFATIETYAKNAQQRSHKIEPKIDTFAENTGLDPDTEIEITHGGGEWNILEFLRGEHEGYALERGGVGLQVSPKTPDTEKRSYNVYAPKADLFFDNRAVLSAKIAPKYLKAAPNKYEAGLTRGAIGHLKEIKVTVLNTGTIWEKSEKGWTEKPSIEQQQERAEKPQTTEQTQEGENPVNP